jgi:hypothetical protein
MTTNNSNGGGEELAFKPSSKVFSENDERWQAQVQTLLQDLRAAGGQVRQDFKPVAGAKGGVAEIIFALGSSGALSLAVMAFKAWLARDKNRVLTFRTAKTADGEEITITGENISEKILEKLLQRIKK